MSTSSSSSSSCSSHRPKEIAPFLKSLRRMLDAEAPATIRWSDDGRAFEIHDLEQLTRRVLPQYFKHAKYTSFQRQLNYFHFRKWTKSRSAVCTFSNPHFVRDDPELAWQITRKRSIPLLSLAAPMPPRTPEPKMTIVVPAPTAETTWPVNAAAPASYPSPTDAQSMMVLIPTAPPHDVFDAYDPAAFYSPSEAELCEALDWLDALYPSLDHVSRLAEHDELS